MDIVARYISVLSVFVSGDAFLVTASLLVARIRDGQKLEQATPEGMHMHC